MQTPFHITSALLQRKELGIFRTLSSNFEGIDFWSNDYLGLSNNSIAIHNIQHIIAKQQRVGSTGSRLISGNSTYTEAVEEYIALQHGKPSAVLFNSGYDANVGLCSSIAGPKDAFICDELIHASLIDGIRLSQKDKYIFKHNNLFELESLLANHASKYESIFVVIESIYSMDGDIAPLKEIAELCTHHRAYLIVDEAHATGLYGSNCTGLVEHFQLQSQVFASIHTYGKAFGLHGASICGNGMLKDYLINFARSFVYSTSAPTWLHLAIQHQYELIQTQQELRERLQSNINHFRKLALNTDFCPQVQDGAIQYLSFGSTQQLIKCSKSLNEAGFLTKAILYPTVPKNKERIRITLHSHNTKDELTILFNTLEKHG